MIRHIVLYTYHKDVPESVITGIYEKLDEISRRLPGRIGYTWGKYKSDEHRNKGYTHALVTDFVDETAQKAFLLDPVRLDFSNQEVLPRMINGLEGLVSFDFIWD